MQSKKARPKWKEFLRWLLVVIVVLFIISNPKWEQPNLLVGRLPSLPFGLWMLILMGAGFLLGRAFPKKKKPKEI